MLLDSPIVDEDPLAKDSERPKAPCSSRFTFKLSLVNAPLNSMPDKKLCSAEEPNLISSESEEK